MKFVVFLFLGIMMHATTATAEDIPAGDAAHGKAIYESICIHCHKLTAEKSAVGAPGFHEVTSRRTLDWINNWIKGPEAFAKVNADAKTLMEGNTMGIKMPTFPEMQIDQNRYDMIEFLKTL